MIVSKDTFFTITKTAISRGYRFLTGDRPNEETMRNLVDTMVSKNIVDKAKESSSEDVTTLAGHVVASTSEQAIGFQAVLTDRTLAVQPHQLPETIKEVDTAITLTDATYGTTYSDPILSITNSAPTGRNRYRHKITSTFSEWLGDILSNISVALKNNIIQTNTNTSNIASLIALSGDSFAGAIPIGGWIEYGGETDPSAGFMIADGRSLVRASYPDAFAVLGVKYGQGDSPGSTFAIPDFTGGQTSKGIDASIVAYNTLGKTGGNNSRMLTIYDLPAHKHPTTSNDATIYIPYNSSSTFDANTDKGAHNHHINIDVVLEGGSSTNTKVVNTNLAPGDPIGSSVLEQAKLDTVTKSVGTRVSDNGGHGHANNAFAGDVGYQYNPGTNPQTALDLNSPFVIVNKIIRVL